MSHKTRHVKSRRRRKVGSKKRRTRNKAKGKKKKQHMSFNVKICDYCNTCFFTDDYEMRNGEIICVLCMDEENDDEEESKLKKNERLDN